MIYNTAPATYKSSDQVTALVKWEPLAHYKECL
jgi:hypothetical protein